MAIERVASNTWITTSVSSQTSVTRALVANATAGSCLVAVHWHATNDVVTFSDNNGNTWTSNPVSYYDGNLVQKISVGYALNVNSGATTVTASSAGVANRLLAVCEYTGVLTTSAVAGTPVSTEGTSSVPAPGGITTSGAAVFIGAAQVYPSAASTANADYTKHVDTTPAGMYTCILEDWIASSAQTGENPDWQTSKDYWSAVGIAFGAAAGGSTYTPRSMLLGVG